MKAINEVNIIKIDRITGFSRHYHFTEWANETYTCEKVIQSPEGEFVSIESFKYKNHAEWAWEVEDAALRCAFHSVDIIG